MAKPISDRVWELIRAGAAQILAAKSDAQKQAALKAITKTVQTELDIDMGTPW